MPATSRPLRPGETIFGGAGVLPLGRRSTDSQKQPTEKPGSSQTTSEITPQENFEQQMLKFLKEKSSESKDRDSTPSLEEQVREAEERKSMLLFAVIQQMRAGDPESPMLERGIKEVDEELDALRKQG